MEIRVALMSLIEEKLLSGDEETATSLALTRKSGCGCADCWRRVFCSRTAVVRCRW